MKKILSTFKDERIVKDEKTVGTIQKSDVESRG